MLNGNKTMAMVAFEHDHHCTFDH